MTQTPSFKGTHLFDRLCWAKENLEGVQSDYRVVYEDSVDECAKILVPDPNWMACALQGGICHLCGYTTNWQRTKHSLTSRSTPEVTCCTTLNQSRL
jgi:hypothetical protein